MQIQMQPSGRGNLKPLPHSASAPELASRGSDGRLISKSQGKADNKPSRWLGPSSPPNPRAKGGALARARAEAASEQAQSQLQGYADDSSYRGSSAGELQDVTGELQLTRQERRSSAASPPLSPKLLSQTSLIDKKKEAHRELEGLKVAAPSYTPSHPVRPLTPHSPPFTPSHRSHPLAPPRTPSHPLALLAPPCQIPSQVSGPSGSLTIQGRGSPSLEEQQRLSPSQLPTGAVARGFSFTRIDESDEADDDDEPSPQQVQRTAKRAASFLLRPEELDAESSPARMARLRDEANGEVKIPPGMLEPPVHCYLYP